MAFPSDYNWKVDITTDSTKVDSNETDFPYHFDLSNISSTDFWNNVQSDGGDLRVSSDSAGSTQLPLEVVSIDTVGQTGEIWFKDDTDSASNKTYYLWWEDTTGTVSQPSASSTFGSENVWNADFNLVYHLQGNVNDSTSNANNGTNNGATSGITGQIGEGYQLDGLDDYFDTNYSHDYTNGITMTCWFKFDAANGDFKRLIGGFDTSNNSGAFAHTLDGNFIRFRVGVSNSFATIDSNTDYNDGSWHKFHGVWDGTTNSGGVKLFIDGVLIGTATAPGTLGSITETIKIGRNGSSSSNFFEGDFDEINIIDTNLSSGWIGTDFNQENDNSTFWTIGTPQQSVTEKSTTFSFDAIIQSIDNTSTFTFDARVQDEKTTQFTADTIIENLNLDSAFSVDTNIKKEDITDTFSFDAIVSLLQDTSFTFDTVIKNPIETTFSFDTLVFKEDNQASFSFDAIVSNPLTFSFDANIKKLDVDPTFTADAVIEEKELDIDISFIADALIVTEDEKNEVTTVVNDFNEILNAQGRQVKLIKVEEEYDSMNQYVGGTESEYFVRAILFPQGQRNHDYNDIGNTAGGSQQAFFKDRYDVNGTIVVPKEGDKFIDPQGKTWRIITLNEWVWSYEVIYMEAIIENVDLTGTTR